MTQKFVLDTSAYSAFLRGDTRLRPFFSAKNTLLVPIIAIGELRAGFAAGAQQQANETILQQFLDSPNIETITLTDKTTRIYGVVYAQLRADGTPIGTNDMWIAALALEHNTLLLTLDTDFSGVRHLVVADIRPLP